MLKAMNNNYSLIECYIGVLFKCMNSNYLKCMNKDPFDSVRIADDIKSSLAHP